MCLAYPSQGDFLTHFDVMKEHVRPQPAYDFTKPPHEGKTNYEVWQWSMTAQQVCAAFAEFLRQKSPPQPRRHRVYSEHLLSSAQVLLRFERGAASARRCPI